MKSVALEFLEGSNGLMAGCIGVLDGWIMNINRPTKKKDGVMNLSHFFSRKGYYFFHSRQCIIMECTFGEVDLRLGIVWKKLGFLLENNTCITDACLCLHNFIIDYRKETGTSTRPESSIFDEDSRRYHATQVVIGGDDCGVFGGGGEEKRDTHGNKLIGGRPLKREQASRYVGKSNLEKIRQEIFLRQWVQPPSNSFKSNNRVQLVENQE